MKTKILSIFLALVVSLSIVGFSSALNVERPVPTVELGENDMVKQNAMPSASSGRSISQLEAVEKYNKPKTERDVLDFRLKDFRKEILEEYDSDEDYQIIDEDDVIDVLDLIELLKHWGACISV